MRPAEVASSTNVQQPPMDHLFTKSSSSSQPPRPMVAAQANQPLCAGPSSASPGGWAGARVYSSTYESPLVAGSKPAWRAPVKCEPCTVARVAWRCWQGRQWRRGRSGATNRRW